MEWFGDVVDGSMVLNDCGGIVKQQLLWLPQQYPYIQLDEWVVMPNHVHAILMIKYPVIVGTGLDLSLHTDLSLHKTNVLSLSNIIGTLKTTSSKRIHLEKIDREFSWQRSYYDHIIRTPQALQNIRRYILNNPKQWDHKKLVKREEGRTS